MDQFRFARWKLIGTTLGSAVVLAILTVAGCKKGAPAAAEQPVPKVTVTVVVSQETTNADEYIGKTEASEMVEVRARVFGYLKSIEFKDGDLVKEDQELFTIEPDEYKAIHEQSLARIDVSKANLELAKSKYARNEKLVKTGAVSQEEYEESLAAVHVAEASITATMADANRTAVDLKHTVLRAPISGRIDRAVVSIGNLLTGGTGSGTLLTKIVKEQPMYVYFDVDERSLLRYMRLQSERRATAPGSLRELGVPCYLQLSDEKDFSHEGQLDFAASEVDPSTGTARIRGVFKNEDRGLVSGLFVRVRVPVGKPYIALLIPERALATDQDIKYVYVVGSDNTATRRTVELGEQRGDFRIIKSGLAAGDRVITKGLQRVKPNQKVEAEVEAIAPEAATARQDSTAPSGDNKSSPKEDTGSKSPDSSPPPEPAKTDAPSKGTDSKPATKES